jgi:hypothetical protein
MIEDKTFDMDYYLFAHGSDGADRPGISHASLAPMNAAWRLIRRK